MRGWSRAPPRDQFPSLVSPLLSIRIYVRIYFLYIHINYIYIYIYTMLRHWMLWWEASMLRHSLNRHMKPLEVSSFFNLITCMWIVLDCMSLVCALKICHELFLEIQPWSNRRFGKGYEPWAGRAFQRSQQKICQCIVDGILQPIGLLTEKVWKPAVAARLGNWLTF